MIGRGDPIVLELAVDEAHRLNHHSIGTEHLLLGLLREGESIAAEALQSLGVNLEKVRTETIRVLSRGGPPQLKIAQMEGPPQPKGVLKILEATLRPKEAVIQSQEHELAPNLHDHRVRLRDTIPS